jgi:alpha-L-fucosidase 2
MRELWYEQEAGCWEEALPLGNGRLGAMVFGGIWKERLQVNEESIWYGGAMERDNPSMKEKLPRIRELIFQGDVPQAEELMELAMSGCPSNMRFYQTLGDISLEFQKQGEVTGYRRSLDLEQGIHQVQFVVGEAIHSRTCFISKPDDCLVMLLNCDQPGKISVKARLSRSLYYDGVGRAGENGIWLYGNLGRGGSEFAMMLKAYAQGGQIRVIGETLCIEGADQVLLLFSGDSSYQATKKEKDRAWQEAQKNRAAMTGQEADSRGEQEERMWQQGLRNMLFERLSDKIDRAALHRQNIHSNQIPNANESAYIDDIESSKAVSEVSKVDGNTLWEELKARHVADYRSLFDRVVLNLNDDMEEQHNTLPTDKRLAAVSAGETDIGLEQLYFDYGRYLLIACSRQEGLPATLQGLWNQEFLPPWGSKYTVNINTQMNYWPAEITNLSECHMPLFRLLRTMIPSGRQTAREMYGCRGFVCHHNTDMYGDTAPQDLWTPGTYWVMGAAWLCTHLWTHYEYTLDQAFLREFFPVMCEAALFFLEFLVEKDGYLVTCPSVSPENTFLQPDGTKGANDAGVTMDNQILRDLFTQCIEAAHVLGVDGDCKITAEHDRIPNQSTVEEVNRNCNEIGATQNGAALSLDIVVDGCVDRNRIITEVNSDFLVGIGITDIPAFIRKLSSTRDKLRPTQISQTGTLLEWREDYDEWEPGHRHISHLYALHPSSQITVDGTPELAKAAKATLERRLSYGGGHTGWSRAWIINHYAKLWEGDTAHENLRLLLSGSTYPNLFDRHPPFQIDGNFGGCAAIAEMLVQSTSKRVVLLPALPTAWASGSVRGLRIKGNAVIDLAWAEGELMNCTITAFAPFSTVLLYKNETYTLTIAQGKTSILSYHDFHENTGSATLSSINV